MPLNECLQPFELAIPSPGFNDSTSTASSGGSVTDPLEDRLHELIGLIYEAALEPTRWQEFMAALSRVYECSSVLWAEDTQAPDANIFATGRFDDGQLRSYVDYDLKTNIWTPLIDPLPTGSIFDARIVPEKEFEACEFYNDWLRPQDLYHSLGIVIANEKGLQTKLSVLRPRDVGFYSDEEMQAWRILAAHVQRAFQIHRRLIVSWLEHSVAEEGLNRLGVAALLVDETGRILSTNPAAMALIETADGIAPPGGRVRARRPPITERLLHVIREAARTAAGRGSHPGAAISLPRRDRRPLSALVSPMWGESFGLGLPVPAALLFIRDSEQAAINRPGDLKALYGLTDAEARLAAALTDGSSLDEIATSTGVSIPTLRTHLKRVMSKAGVNRQGELIRLVLRSAATLGHTPI